MKFNYRTQEYYKFTWGFGIVYDEIQESLAIMFGRFMIEIQF